jgi:type IV secretion system protein VirB1
MIREAVLALAMQCVPPDTASLMVGISQHESNFNPLAIHDNTTSQSYSPATEAEAEKVVTSLVAAGHSVDAGIAQINSANWEWTGLTARSVFDPCLNLKAGVKVLLARYNGGTAYAGAVLRVLNHTPAPVPSSAVSVIEESAVIDDRPADNDDDNETFFNEGKPR